MTKHLILTAALALSAARCTPNNSEPANDAGSAVTDAGASSFEHLSPFLPGHHQVPLGITSDNHVLYQEGNQVFASSLEASASRQLVAEVPSGNYAFVYVSGKVAFCWTNPDRTLPGYGVSPLVIWSAATGAHLADEESPIGTYSSASSPDGTRVVYPARSNPERTMGDLEFASTDLSVRSTLAAGIPMGFPVGYCRPWAAFSGSRPVALFCQPGEQTATLSLWTGETRTDLVTGGATPPFFSADESGTSFFTTLAATESTPAKALVVSEGKAPIVVDEVVARTGWIMHDDSVVYVSREGGSVSVKRFNPEDGSRTTIIAPLGNFLTPLAGSDLVTRSWFSPDRKKVSYFTTVSPNSGLVDQRWVDVSGSTQTFVADAQNRNWSGIPTFTLDSNYFLFARSTDLANGLGVFVAQSQSSAVEFSDQKGWSYLPAAGPLVTFIDNFDLTASTGDLRVADVSRNDGSSRHVETEVDPNFLVSPDGRWVVFTKNSGPAASAGLYAARTDG